MHCLQKDRPIQAVFLFGNLNTQKSCDNIKKLTGLTLLVFLTGKSNSKPRFFLKIFTGFCFANLQGEQMIQVSLNTHWVDRFKYQSPVRRDNCHLEININENIFFEPLPITCLVIPATKPLLLHIRHQVFHRLTIRAIGSHRE